MATQQDLLAQIAEFDASIEAADVATFKLLELSGVKPEVSDAIGKLIERRSYEAEQLSRAVEAFQNMMATDVVVFEVVVTTF